MDTNKTKFEQAEQCLASAQTELNRPAEDVVSIMVYRSVQKSITHYLMGFLLKNNTAFDEGDTLEVLLQKCKAIDSKFNNFDLSPLTFTKISKYSNEFDQMENCMNLARYTKKLVS
jgi:hypothetical protein